MAWLATGTDGRRISWGNCRWCDFILFYENQTRDYWCGYCKKANYTPAPLKVPDGPNSDKKEEKSTSQK